MDMSKLSRDQKSKFRIVFLILVLVGIFIYTSFLIVGVSPGRNTDFVTFWTAGYMAGHGLNPYNSVQWLATRHQFGVTWDPDYIFPYPLALALFLWPLSFFDYSQAFRIWVFLSQAAIAGSCILLTSHISPENRAKLFIPLIAGLVIFRPVWVILLYGQIGAFLLFILSLSILLLENKKWFWGGFFITLIMLKPSIGFVIVGAAFIWSIWQKRWNLIAGQVVTGASLFLIGWLQDKNWIAETIEYGNLKFSSTYGIHPTLWGWRAFICDGQSVCNTLTLGIMLLILLSIYFLWKRLDFRSPGIMLGVVTPLALIFAPYIWMYDHVLCILSTTVLMVELVSRSQSFWRIAFIPLLVGILSWLLLAIASIIMQDIWGAALPVVCYFLYFMIPVRYQKNGGVAEMMGKSF